MPRKAASPSDKAILRCSFSSKTNSKHGDDQQGEEDVEGAFVIEQPGCERLRHGEQQRGSEHHGESPAVADFSALVGECMFSDMVLLEDPLKLSSGP